MATSNDWNHIEYPGPDLQDYVDEVYPHVVCMGCDVTIGTPIAVIAGQTTGNIDFALTKGGAISGHASDSLDGIFLYSSKVYVYALGRSTPARFAYVESAAYQGSYTVRGLAPGSYVVRTAAGEGFAFGFNVVNEIYDNVQCLTLPQVMSPTDGCASAGTLVTVTAGTTRSGVDFDLAPGGGLYGFVTDPSGDNGPFSNGSNAARLYTAAGRDLGFSSEGYTSGFGFGFLPAGTYFVRSVNTLGYIDERYDNQPCVPASVCDVGITGGTPVVIGASEVVGPINLALAPGGRISGVIRNATTSATVAAVTVQVFDAAGQFISDAVSDSAGAYLTRAGLPSGTSPSCERSAQPATRMGCTAAWRAPRRVRSRAAPQSLSQPGRRRTASTWRFSRNPVRSPRRARSTAPQDFRRA